MFLICTPAKVTLTRTTLSQTLFSYFPNEGNWDAGFKNWTSWGKKQLYFFGRRKTSYHFSIILQGFPLIEESLIG
jgi:hypothetical protein